jgi:hypothetical protein
MVNIFNGASLQNSDSEILIGPLLSFLEPNASEARFSVNTSLHQSMWRLDQSTYYHKFPKNNN